MIYGRNKGWECQSEYRRHVAGFQHRNRAWDEMNELLHRVVKVTQENRSGKNDRHNMP